MSRIFCIGETLIGFNPKHVLISAKRR
ncbi:fructokinase [Bacillus paralicheniformis]|nr:fructokinase [Bacillus paralicheniformis]POO81775.1 fructokinase [Bacillus sp. MBGLi97]KAA0842610.1 fructokinase [Bacillus paralicheniformis]MDR4212056.1 fructokinase [Bacillus paralicheniformis]PLC15154.1 fructokinase [Bacillus paralicheniformis]